MNYQGDAFLRDMPILELAERMHKAALHRSYAFSSSIFKTPAWLIMLTLFILNRSGSRSTLAALRGANMLTEEEGLEAIRQLTDAGLINMPSDGGVEISPGGLTQMDSYLRQI